MRILDIFTAPAPAQLVADVRQIGYDGAAGYVVDLAVSGRSTWSPAHVEALRAAGLVFLPIVVPGEMPPPADGLWGWWDGTGPIELDLEPGSEPPVSWVADWISAVRRRGGSPGMYGPAADHRVYGGLDWDWRCLANWTYSEPAAPPAGFQGVQWTNLMVVNGTRYDASVFSEEVFLPVAQLDEILSLVQAINDRTGQIWNSQNWGTPTGGDVPQGWTPITLARIAQAVGIDPASVGNKVPAAGPNDLVALVQAVKAKLDAVPAGGGLTAAQAQALQEAHDAITRIESALKGA